MTALLSGAALVGAVAQNYNVVVTTKDGNIQTFRTENIHNIIFSEAPDMQELEYLYGAFYRTQEQTGVYRVRMANCPIDQTGEPGIVGGYEIDITMYAPLSEDRLNAQLPVGTYTLGNTVKSMTWDVLKSGLFIRLDEGDDGVTQHMFIDGTVNVTRNDVNYTVECDLSLITGEHIITSYTGPIKFELSTLETDEFTEDINITLDGSQVRYYANWFYPLSDDLLMQCWNGEFTDDGTTQLSGYWVNMPLYITKQPNPESGLKNIPDGVYTTETRNLQNRLNVPFTYQYGRILDFFGTPMPADAYVTFIDKQGINKRALLTEGTLTVSDNGTKFVFDMETDTPGVHFKATMNGAPNMFNFVDNSNAFPVDGTLTSNYNLKFNQDQVAFAYKNDDYVVKGLSYFELYVTDPNYVKGDYLQLHLIAEGDVLPDGTYEINNSLVNKSGLCGAISPGGELILSWFADLSSEDAAGNQTVVAPIFGGSITVSTTDSNERKIEVNLKDEKGNTISGTYQGFFTDLNSGDFEKPARRKLGRK